MRARNFNLVLFAVLLAFLIALPCVCGNMFLSHQDAPWQLLPFNSGDSLSMVYKERYRVFDAPALIRQIEDSSRTTVSIMVDGWGVPYDENMLADDFGIFEAKTAQFALHKRLLGHTAHAEAVETRVGFENGLLIGRGDSSECARQEAFPRFGAKQSFCCLNCTDKAVAGSLDSILTDTTWKRIEWTARGTNLGDRDKLHDLLRQLAEIAAQHPDVQFIIQGTHRPILGAPEVRRKYNARWVPAVFINCKLKTEKK
jgi:hypothetical protein